MSAGDQRRREDIRRLQSVCAASAGRLQILSTRGEPAREVTIEIACKTAASAGYPDDVSQRTKVRIQFPDRYPFQEPLAEIQTPIFHPNVYSSGRICFGTKWIPTEGLDLLVRRIVAIVTFDPSLVNVSSPANAPAAAWYRSVVTAHAHAFPTDTLSFESEDRKAKTMQWRDMSPNAAGGTRIVHCSRCSQALRVPDRAGVRTRCPKCGNTFVVTI
jgi:hypothetical protein